MPSWTQTNPWTQWSDSHSNFSSNTLCNNNSKLWTIQVESSQISNCLHSSTSKTWTQGQNSCKIHKIETMMHITEARQWSTMWRWWTTTSWWAMTSQIKWSRQLCQAFKLLKAWLRYRSCSVGAFHLYSTRTLPKAFSNCRTHNRITCHRLRHSWTSNWVAITSAVLTMIARWIESQACCHQSRRTRRCRWQECRCKIKWLETRDSKFNLVYKIAIKMTTTTTWAGNLRKYPSILALATTTQWSSRPNSKWSKEIMIWTNPCRTSSFLLRSRAGFPNNTHIPWWTSWCLHKIWSKRSWWINLVEKSSLCSTRCIKPAECPSPRVLRLEMNKGISLQHWS